MKNAAFLIPEMMWRCGLAPLPFWKSSDSDELLLGTAAIGIDDVHTLLKALNGVILGLNLAGYEVRKVKIAMGAYAASQLLEIDLASMGGEVRGALATDPGVALWDTQGALPTTAIISLEITSRRLYDYRGNWPTHASVGPELAMTGLSFGNSLVHSDLSGDASYLAIMLTDAVADLDEVVNAIGVVLADIEEDIAIELAKSSHWTPPPTPDFYENSGMLWMLNPAHWTFPPEQKTRILDALSVPGGFVWDKLIEDEDRLDFFRLRGQWDYVTQRYSPPEATGDSGPSVAERAQALKFLVDDRMASLVSRAGVGTEEVFSELEDMLYIDVFLQLVEIGVIDVFGALPASELWDGVQEWTDIIATGCYDADAASVSDTLQVNQAGQAIEGFFQLRKVALEENPANLGEDPTDHARVDIDLYQFSGIWIEPVAPDTLRFSFTRWVYGGLGVPSPAPDPVTDVSGEMEFKILGAEQFVTIQIAGQSDAVFKRVDLRAHRSDFVLQTLDSGVEMPGGNGGKLLTELTIKELVTELRNFPLHSSEQEVINYAASRLAINLDAFVDSPDSMQSGVRATKCRDDFKVDLDYWFTRSNVGADTYRRGTGIRACQWRMRRILSSAQCAAAGRSYWKVLVDMTQVYSAPTEAIWQVLQIPQLGGAFIYRWATTESISPGLDAWIGGVQFSYSLMEIQRVELNEDGEVANVVWRKGFRYWTSRTSAGVLPPGVSVASEAGGWNMMTTDSEWTEEDFTGASVSMVGVGLEWMTVHGAPPGQVWFTDNLRVKVITAVVETDIGGFGLPGASAPSAMSKAPGMKKFSKLPTARMDYHWGWLTDPEAPESLPDPGEAVAMAEAGAYHATFNGTPFVSGSSVPTPEFEAVLRGFCLAHLWSLQGLKSGISIEGRADTVGDDALNLALSVGRASNTLEKIRDILGTQLNARAALVEVFGTGESVAGAGGVDDENSPEYRAVLISLGGVPQLNV